MQPLYLYYYRNMNPPLDDTPYINNLIRELIEDEKRIIESFEYLSHHELNIENEKIYKDMINDSKDHIRILKVIYTNINNKLYEDDSDDKDVITNLKDIVLLNVVMSKKYRKILYSLKSDVHRFMLNDIIIDNTNNSILLNMLMK